MADPFAILAESRPDSGGLIQAYNGLQRQRLSDMYLQKQMQRQDMVNSREDAAYEAQQAARNLIAAGAKPEDVIKADPTTGFAYATHAQQIAQHQRELQGARAHAVGTAAMTVASLPAADQPAAWDKAIDGLVQQGYTDLDQYKGHYDPKALPALIAASSEASKAYLDQTDKDRTYQEAVRSHKANEGTAARNAAVGEGGLRVRQHAEDRTTKWGPQPLIGVMPHGDGADLDAKYGGQ